MLLLVGRAVQGPGRPDTQEDPRRADREGRADVVRDLLAPGDEASARVVPAGDLPAPRPARGPTPPSCSGPRSPSRPDGRAGTSSTTSTPVRWSTSSNDGSPAVQNQEKER